MDFQSILAAATGDHGAVNPWAAIAYLVSGVFFPLSQLPAPLQAITHFLPLSHAVELVRPLMSGGVPDRAVLHLAVLAAYAVPGYYIALVLTRRRLLK